MVYCARSLRLAKTEDPCIVAPARQTDRQTDNEQWLQSQEQMDGQRTLAMATMKDRGQTLAPIR